jgi:hypothetical protein
LRNTGQHACGDGENDERNRFHGKADEVLPGGRGVERVATGRLRWPLADSPKAGGLDMRHRLPGHLVGLAASFAVDADRLLRGLSHPHPPERTSEGGIISNRMARTNFRILALTRLLLVFRRQRG